MGHRSEFNGKSAKGSAKASRKPSLGEKVFMPSVSPLRKFERNKQAGGAAGASSRKKK